MTKTIAEQKADLLKKLSELEELEKQEWPSYGYRYWTYMYTCCAVEQRWENVEADLSYKLEGNCHRTEAEALAWGAKRDKLLRVTTRLKELQGGWVPDWNDDDIVKFEPYYDHDTEEWETNCEYLAQSWFATPPFQTREALQSALDELGDDMNVFLEVV